MAQSEVVVRMKDLKSTLEEVEEAAFPGIFAMFLFPVGVYCFTKIAADMARNAPGGLRAIFRDFRNLYPLIFGLPAAYLLLLVLPWKMNVFAIQHLAEVEAFGGLVTRTIDAAASVPALVAVYQTFEMFL